MNNEIKVFQNKQIRVREDGYFSATDMCQAVGKQLGHWRENKATSEYLRALEQSIGIPIDQLVEINESHGSNEQRGTWVHRRVAIRLAQWLSPGFAVQVDQWVEEILTGDRQAKQPQAKLPEPQPITDNTIAIHLQAITTFQDNGDLQLASLLKTRFGNLLLAEQQQLLAGTETVNLNVEGVIDIAIRFKIRVPKNYEAPLGKYVKARCSHLIQGQNQRYSSASQKIVTANMYPANHPDVEKAVLEFAAMKSLPVGGD